MTRLVEIFGGLGAYSLLALSREATHRTGKKYRSEPPVGRMGNKASFAPAVLRHWGLGRVRWSGVWLNDLDPVCHLFHRLYASDELRTAVARRLWSWIPCPVCHTGVMEQALLGTLRPTPAMLEPLARPGGCLECNDTGTRDARRLWEWLRSEPVPDDLTEATARAVYLQSRSFSLKPVSIRGGMWDHQGWKPEVDTSERAPTSHAAGEDSPRWAVAERLEALPPMMWVGQGWKPECSMQPGRQMAEWAPRYSIASRIESMPPAGTIHITRQDAALCLPVGDCRDCLVVLDSPYLGDITKEKPTSGYAHLSTRETVLNLAGAWDRAGALVLIHEAVGLEKELGGHWGSRGASVLRGRSSSFWGIGGEREVLTFNKSPLSWPAEQIGLFGR